MPISQRAANVAVSATGAITERAKELAASGLDVISFGAGEPDFPTPDHIVSAAIEAVRNPINHKYSPAAGLPQLREAVAGTATASALAVNAKQVLITNGAKTAVYIAFQTLLDPGDEVLVPAPYWVSYPEIIKLADGTPVPVFAGVGQGYKVSVDQLEAAVTDKTKALLFVSPSNPTGAVYSGDEVKAIGEWAAQRGLWVVTDEIYEHFTYGTEFASLPVTVPAAAERTIVINGVSKAYSMTGWRVGWLIAPPEAAAAAIRLQSQISTNVSNVSQRAAVAGLEAGSGHPDMMRAAFDARRQVMYEALSDIDGIVCPNPQGAFYMFPDVSALIGRELAGTKITSSHHLAELALEAAQVAVVPGEPFGAPGHVRFSFALDDADLQRGMDRFVSFASGR
ncbi:MAG: pyridoxal phosphate-dependent aminotransferase [Acidimicrobiia bacterium]|nr:pyridoxal phosphate-dependent aminotransferase [Acidimicrobiia bacterium]